MFRNNGGLCVREACFHSARSQQELRFREETDFRKEEESSAESHRSSYGETTQTSVKGPVQVFTHTPPLSAGHMMASVSFGKVTRLRQTYDHYMLTMSAFYIQYMYTWMLCVRRQSWVFTTSV